MKYRFAALVLLVSVTLTAYSPPTDDPDALVGRWLSSKKKNQVQIYKQGNKYFGKLVWMAEPNDPTTNKPKVDSQNADEKLQSRRMLEMHIMTDFVYKGDNVWSDGKIYNPEDGKTYGGELTLKDYNSLDVHGYIIGLPFLGKSKTWTRVK